MPFKNSEMNEYPSETQYLQYVSSALRKKRYIHRNIILINDLNDDRILTERAPIAIDEDNNVHLRELILHLCSQNLIDAHSSIFYYDTERDVFVHSGREPLPHTTMVPLRKFAKDEIKIKYRAQDQSRGMQASAGAAAAAGFDYNFSQFAQNSAFRQQNWFPTKSVNSNMNTRIVSSIASGNVQAAYMTTTTTLPNQLANNPTNENMIMNFEDDQAEDNIQSVDPKAAIPREKRVKERQIGYVRERVQEWRRYYETGVANEHGNLVKVNLDVAAGIVGLSRKTLDDYYKYIRKAETFNFDFELHKEEKIGMLRNFVRDRQKRTPNNTNSKQQISNKRQNEEEYEELEFEEDEDDTQTKQIIHMYSKPAPIRKQQKVSASPSSASPAVNSSIPSMFPPVEEYKINKQQFTLRPSSPEHRRPQYQQPKQETMNQQFYRQTQQSRGPAAEFFSEAHQGICEDNNIQYQQYQPIQEEVEQQQQQQQAYFNQNETCLPPLPGLSSNYSQPFNCYYSESANAFSNCEEKFAMEMEPASQDQLFFSDCQAQQLNFADDNLEPMLVRNPSLNGEAVSSSMMDYQQYSYMNSSQNNFAHKFTTASPSPCEFSGALPQPFDSEYDFLNQPESNYFNNYE